MNERRWAHCETWAQMIVGAVLNQLVLWWFNIPFSTALTIFSIMFVVSYIRTYTIRRIFHGIRSISRFHSK